MYIAFVDFEKVNYRQVVHVEMDKRQINSKMDKNLTTDSSIELHVNQLKTVQSYNSCCV